MQAIHDLEQSLQEHGDKIDIMHRNLSVMLNQSQSASTHRSYIEIITIVSVVAILQAVLFYYS